MTVRVVRPLHVGVNLLWMVPGVVGGSEDYTVRLLRAFADRRPPDVRLTLFVNRLFLAAHPDLAAGFRVVVAPVTGRSKPRRVLAESTWLASAARRERVDLVHHMGGIVPALRSAPAVVTIHDLQPLAMPEFFSTAKRRFAAVSIPASARAARRVATLTEFTRDDIVNRLGARPDRVAVVPPGFERPAPVPAVAVDSVLGRYGVEAQRYFLYPAITYPHKNHLLLVRSLALLQETAPGVALVLTGGAAQTEEAVRSAVGALGLRRVVFRTGRIPAADLDALYRAAAGLTFPSLFEGFGLPVLEAMSRGCPVVAADATALPEVVGRAGLLVSPHDPGAWAAAMLRVLDPGERARLVEAGRRRAGEFAWDESLDRLLGLYRGAAEAAP